MVLAVKQVFARSVLNRHKRRDAWFLDDYSLNPYVGCGYGCVYCYVHGSKYGSRSAEGLGIKVNAPAVLARELSREVRAGRRGYIVVASATEAWCEGLEDRYGLTRRCLGVIARYGFPVHCVTKSTLILRDLDVLGKVRESARLPPDLRGRVDGVLITFSLSTLREGIARVFEPSAPPPEERLRALVRVRDEGFQAGIAFIPVLPYVSDDELEEMIRVAKDCGVDYVYVASLTLDAGVRERYLRVIESKYPELVSRYESLYSGRGSEPRRDYVVRLYREALRLVKECGLRFGPTNINPLAES